MCAMKCNLRYWMADAKIATFAEVSRMTGLETRTISKMWYEVDLESIQAGTYIRVANAFNRPMTELIEYVPENGKAPTND